MPRPCSICINVKSSEISRNLALGVPFRALALQYEGVTSTSLHRHLKNCLRAPRRSQKTEKPEKRTGTIHPKTNAGDSLRHETEAEPKALIRRAELLLDDATVICSKAKDEGDSRLALQALRECRSSLELLMKAHGMLAGDTSTTILDQRRQSIQLFAKLDEATLRKLAAGETIDAEALPTG